LADSLTAQDLLSCGQKWLACLTPFFKESERKTSICLVFLKLFERLYSRLTASLLQPYRADSKLQDHKRTQLDRLYQKIVDDLDALLHAVGIKAA
jgi:hypothetical protein